MRRDDGYSLLGLRFLQEMVQKSEGENEASPLVLAHNDVKQAVAKPAQKAAIQLAEKTEQQTKETESDDDHAPEIKAHYGRYSLEIDVPDLVLVDNAAAAITIASLFMAIMSTHSATQFGLIKALIQLENVLPDLLSNPSLFTDGEDNRNFNLENALSFNLLNVMDASAGDDHVILPNSLTVAEAFNFDLSRSFNAGEGNDSVTLGNLSFQVDLGSGNDTLIAGAIRQDAPVTTPINNTLDGGDGTDILDYSQLAQSDNTVFIEANLATAVIAYSQISNAGDVNDPLDNTVPSHAVFARDSVSHFEQIVGTDNTVQGDVFIVSNTSFNGFNINGGGGAFDTISFSAASSAITFDLSSAANISNVESIIGSNFNDTLTGDANDNVINGGLGNDVLTGGAGSDNFIFDVSYDVNGYMIIEGFDQVVDLSAVDTLTFRGVIDKNGNMSLDLGDLDLGTPFGTALFDFGAGNDVQTNLAGAPNGQIIFTGIGTAGNTITSFTDLSGFYDIDII